MHLPCIMFHVYKHVHVHSFLCADSEEYECCRHLMSTVRHDTTWAVSKTTLTLTSLAQVLKYCNMVYNSDDIWCSIMCVYYDSVASCFPAFGEIY